MSDQGHSALIRAATDPSHSPASARSSGSVQSRRHRRDRDQAAVVVLYVFAKKSWWTPRTKLKDLKEPFMEDSTFWLRAQCARISTATMSLFAVLTLGPGDAGAQTPLCSNSPGEDERIECMQPSTSTTDIDIFPRGIDIERRTLLATALPAIMEWAVEMEFRADNPCGHIGPVLGPLQAVVRQKCGS